MMRRLRNVAVAAAALSIGSGVVAVEAASAIVEAAKDNCVVGEQADGYLGFVDGQTGSEELRREVRDVNQQRKAIYADLARRNGVTVEVTAALTAEKLIAQASVGECVRDSSGRWIKR